MTFIRPYLDQKILKHSPVFSIHAMDFPHFPDLIRKKRCGGKSASFQTTKAAIRRGALILLQMLSRFMQKKGSLRHSAFVIPKTLFSVYSFQRSECKGSGIWVIPVFIPANDPASVIRNDQCIFGNI